MTEARSVGTAERILDAAERLVQTRGFNGFSYADIADELGVTKPSLHYHFAGKADLGEALINRYAKRFAEALQAIDVADGDAITKLTHYAALYGNVLDKERMCLCGMLAADFETLPAAMRTAVVHFFDDNEDWLGHILADGQATGAVRYEALPRAQAQLVLSTLEGAMLVARSYRDPERFRAAARQLVSSLTRATAEDDAPS